MCLEHVNMQGFDCITKTYIGRAASSKATASIAHRPQALSRDAQRNGTRPQPTVFDVPRGKLDSINDHRCSLRPTTAPESVEIITLGTT